MSGWRWNVCACVSIAEKLFSKGESVLTACFLPIKCCLHAKQYGMTVMKPQVGINFK